MGCWWVTSDCCGLFCANFTVGLLIYAQVVQVMYCIGPWLGYTSAHVIVYTVFSFLALFSHTKCQYMDPGAVPMDMLPDMQTGTRLPDGRMEYKLRVTPICRRCATVKPSEVHHCSMCSRCIVRMDHHCPWVNNCVALFNQKYFLLFVFYTACCCVWCFVALICQFIECSQDFGFSRPPEMCQDNNPVGIVLLILNFVEAVVFGLFTIIMLCDQFSAIADNTPYIDRLKGKMGIQRSLFKNLSDVFGEPGFSFWWFMPSGPSAYTIKHFWSLVLADRSPEERLEILAFREQHGGTLPYPIGVTEPSTEGRIPGGHQLQNHQQRPEDKSHDPTQGQEGQQTGYAPGIRSPREKGLDALRRRHQPAAANGDRGINN